MEMKTWTLPKASAIPVGKEMGIAVNRLGTLLPLPRSGAADAVAREALWKTGLELLLQPKNLSFLMLLFPDDSLLWTTVLRREEEAALLGDEKDRFHLQPMAPAEISRIFSGYFANVPAAAPIRGHCSLPSFLLLAALLDLERKKRYFNLLSHTVGDPTLRIGEIETEIAEARTHRDLRWLLPFMLEAISYSSEIDIAAALAELETLGLLENKAGEIQVSAAAEPLLSLFRSRNILCAVESLYFFEQALQSQVTVILGGGEGLCRIELGEDAVMETVDAAELERTFTTLFAPGEEPGVAEMPEESQEEAKSLPVEGGESPWRCRCGQQNSGGFCAKCGRRQEESGNEGEAAALCRQCGAPMAAKFKFCRHCGAPR